jgi:hypothetical protein
MKMSKRIVISSICIIAVLSASASRKAGIYTITIDGRKYEVGIDETLLNEVSGSGPVNDVRFVTPEKHDARFVTCENHAGTGFFWVDTCFGAVWWANPAEEKWEYYGSPESTRGNVGRYIPYENKSGAGLYILDTDRGQGWWTNGEQWKEMGMPQKKTDDTRQQNCE